MRAGRCSAWSGGSPVSSPWPRSPRTDSFGFRRRAASRCTTDLRSLLTKSRRPVSSRVRRPRSTVPALMLLARTVAASSRGAALGFHGVDPEAAEPVAVAAHWATASEEVDDAQRDCGGEDAERNSFRPRSLAGVLRRDLGSTSQRCGRKTGRKHVATRFSTRSRRPCASYRRLR
jgi:hypothetical protein